MMEVEPVSQQDEPGGTFLIAVRPALLFVTAFALNVTPHEAVHAAVGYLLGFDSTLFQMWVNPDAAAASPRQAAAIAASGPIFSLTLGSVSWLLYRWRYRTRPAGLMFLMLTVVGIYSFLGPLTGAALGGDFSIVLKAMAAPKMVQNAVSFTGLILLPLFMFFMGRELSYWSPRSFGRTAAVVCSTCAPWFIGTLLTLLVYWPLPKFLVGPTVLGSMFWFFAVLGASFGYVNARSKHLAPALTKADIVLTVLALIMVRALVHGIRLAH